MVSFGRKPSRSEISASVDKLINVLEAGGFSRETALVLGGAALAFSGIRPANDLDLMVPGALFASMEEAGKTPGGIRVLRKQSIRPRHPFLATHDSPLYPLALPMDITFPHGVDGTIDPAKEEAFISTLPDFDTVAGYRFLPPGLVAEHKASLTPPRRKDRRDIELIERYLRP